MNIRKAPIIDLVEFIIEEKASENNYNSILELINKYYTIIEHEQILPIITAQEAILKDWCFGDYSYDMSKMPNTEGLLVVNKEGLWGITTLYYNRTDDPVIKIQVINHNRFDTLTFQPKDWCAYGYMGKYFKYPKYNENHDLPFGARILKPGDNGNDVLIFQNILRKYNSSLPLTGEFDKDTFQIYVQAQKSYGLELKEIFNPEDISLIRMLCNGH